ncbi:mannitol-1-phosphate 5-dehydrogenase [Micrococcales bacterium 31B]|nr:mannitol-1-phosphate 5-dehydrogenase [Micrococcales bacterium 31B]
MPTAVHFGAGNIGRGFVGLILHNSGYEVIFADVAAPLIEALQTADSYEVREVGAESKTTVVDAFRALNSASQEAEVIAEIAAADIVTTAVGPNILKFVAPVIAKGLAARAADATPLQVMACENALGATDILAGHIAEHCSAEEYGRGVYANTAVDRIVPAQAPDAGLNVTVETYFEWAIEQGAFGDNVPDLVGATFVDDLGPYIERKLFTVNTGHATTAYFGLAAGVSKISDAVAHPEVRPRVEATLAETKALLVDKYGFEPEVQQGYIDKILGRFANPHLPDTAERVGREPLRKLSRNERFISPAAQLAERGLGTDALVATVAAALAFDVAEDAQSVQMQQLLTEASATDAAQQITGLEPDHPLFPAIERVIAEHQGR